MGLRVQQLSTGHFNIKMILEEPNIKLGFHIKTILADDIDAICEGRDSKNSYLCLLDTNNVAVLENIDIPKGLSFSIASLVNKYNAQPNVRNGKYPRIIKHTFIEQNVIEGVVTAGSAYRYFTN